jgi:predicted transcriptional regulator
VNLTGKSAEAKSITQADSHQLLVGQRAPALDEGGGIGRCGGGSLGEMIANLPTGATMVLPILDIGMTTTTSLKLPDALKQTIALIAAQTGKTAHALMVETLQTAMDDALARQAFYLDGEQALADTLRSNQVYAAEDVKAYLMQRVQGQTPKRPLPIAFAPSRARK